MIVKCNKCKEEINKEDLEKNYYICPLCGKLNRMPAKNRLQMLTEKFDVMFNDQEFTDPIVHHTRKSMSLPEKRAVRQRALYAAEELSADRIHVYSLWSLTS